jgi:hypothetical protein
MAYSQKILLSTTQKKSSTILSEVGIQWTVFNKKKKSEIFVIPNHLLTIILCLSSWEHLVALGNYGTSWKLMVCIPDEVTGLLVDLILPAAL